MKKIIGFLLVFFVTTAAMATTPEVPGKLVGKTVTLVVAYPPGGGADTITRAMAAQAQKISGISFNIVNRGGALGVLAGQHVVEAAPDGLTLLAHANETQVINPLVKDINAVDPNKLRPVTIHALTPQFFYVGTKSNIRNLQDLVKQAKNNPKFTVGYSTTHNQLYMLQFFQSVGVDPYMVKFKALTEMAISVHQGDIDVFGADANAGYSFVQNGKIRAIATGWNKELSVYPNAVPANILSPGFIAYNIQMVSAPAGTPDHIVDFFNKLFRQAMHSPELQDRWQAMQIILQDLDPKQSESLLTAEKNKFSKLLNNIK